MICTQLFEKILLEPAVKESANSLFIVSGYASATMVSRHIEALKRFGKLDTHIRLIVGMCPTDGLLRSNHESFKKIQTDYSLFECSYLVHNYSVHSKLYSWFLENTAVAGFLGSANYTQGGFDGKQREAMVSLNADIGRDYFYELLEDSISCLDAQVDDLIKLFDHETIRRIRVKKDRGENVFSVENPTDIKSLESVRISLLDRKGRLPAISGLNWGQRRGRNKNQAYLRIPVKLSRTDFFPPVGTHFTILTDDEKSLLCSRAQQFGKAIHTPVNNSTMGEYFRYRLGLSNGAFVKLSDLENYGRTDVEITKIDEETFFLDFSPVT